MAGPAEPLKAKLFAGVLAGSTELLDSAKKELEKKFGAVDFESPTMPFDSTEYYEPQMGKGLLRKFYTFGSLTGQDSLSRIKLATNAIEQDFRGRSQVDRPINIDPGLLLPSKIILASCKDFSHRIYLGEGVYGEVTLQYVKDAFVTLPWTFPDYRLPKYHEFFKKARELYLAQMRSQRKGPNPRNDHSVHE